LHQKRTRGHDVGSVTAIEKHADFDRRVAIQMLRPSVGGCLRDALHVVVIIGVVLSGIFDAELKRHTAACVRWRDALRRSLGVFVGHEFGLEHIAGEGGQRISERDGDQGEAQRGATYHR